MIRTRALLALVAVLAALAVGGAWASGILDRAEDATVDVRFRVRGDRPQPARVAVVAIDDRTLAALRMRSPIPRDRQAALLRRIARAGARTIAVDLEYREPTAPAEGSDGDEVADEDVALVEALDAVRPTVLGTTAVDAATGTPATLGFLADLPLREIGALGAHVAFGTGHGGAFRRLPITVDGLPTMPVAAATVAGRGPTRPDGLPSARAIAAAIDAAPRDAWIDYPGGPGRVLTVSAIDVLRGAPAVRALRGRVVVLGDTTQAAQDIHPGFDGRQTPGAEIEAAAIDTVLRGYPLRSASDVVPVLLLLLASALPALAALRLGGRGQLAVAGVLGATLVGIDLLAFASGRILVALPPLLGLVVATVGALAVSTAGERRAHRRARATLERFAPPSVVDGLLAARDVDPRLPPVELDATVLFCDLRGFTAFAAGREPAEVLGVLDRYLTVVTETVAAHEGTVVSFLGDGVMAVFGAPVRSGEHADRALAVGRALVGPGIAEVNRAAGTAFAIGVGLNSGPVVSGTVGPAQRIEYATIGDTTNVAAKVQAHTKSAGHPLLVSAATRERLRDASGLRRVVDLDAGVAGRTVEVFADSGEGAAGGNGALSSSDA